MSTAAASAERCKAVAEWITALCAGAPGVRGQAGYSSTATQSSGCDAIGGTTGVRRRAARRLYSRGRAPAEPAVDEQRKAWISSSQNPRTAYDACHVATAVCFVLLRIRITLQWRSSGRLPEAEGFRNGAKGKAAEAIVQCAVRVRHRILQQYWRGPTSRWAVPRRRSAAALQHMRASAV